VIGTASEFGDDELTPRKSLEFGSKSVQYER